MVFLSIAALTLIATVVLIGVDVYGVIQEHEDAGETIEAMDALSEGLESFVDKISQVFEDLAQVVYDAAMAIMQYMDAWGTVSIILFAIVIVILIAVLYEISRVRRYL